MPILHLDPDQPDRLKIVSAPFEDNALRQIGARWRSKGYDYFHIAKGLAPVYGLKGMFGDNLTYSPEVVQWLQEENAGWVAGAHALRQPHSDLNAITESTRIAEIRDAIHSLSQGLWKGTFELRPFQQVGVAMLLNSQGCIMADEPGLGKSIQGAAAIRVAHETYGDSLPAMVIAPSAVIDDAWMRAFALVAPDLKVMVLRGTPAQRRKQLVAFTEENYDVMVTTYGMISAHSRCVAYGNTALKRCVACGGPKSEKEIKPERCEAHLKELNEIPWKTIVVDEAHHVFDMSTTQTRALHGLAAFSPARYRWPMTGTPLEGSPMNWWALLKFVSPEEWPSSVAFRFRYVETQMSWAGYEEILGLRPETRTELNLATAPRFIRRLKQEVAPDLPKQIDVYRRVELSKKERDIYDKFRDDLIVALNDNDLYATNPAVAFGRLLQLAASTCEIYPERNDDTGEMDFGLVPVWGKGNPSSLLDAVEEARKGEFAGQRIMFSCASRKLLEVYAAEALDAKGIRYAMITGSTPKAERAAQIAEFNAGTVDYILLTAAGGEGVSLTGFSTMFDLMPFTSRIKTQQMRDRGHGIGRGDQDAESFLYVHFDVADTVYGRVYESLKEKNDLADSVLSDSDRIAWLLGAETK